MGHVPFSAERSPQIREAFSLSVESCQEAAWLEAQQLLQEPYPPPRLMQELITCAQALASPVIRAASLYLCAQL